MIDCPIYLTLPGTETTPDPVTDTTNCVGCSCSYLQYESLLPYLKEIRDSHNLTDEQTIEFEFKFREQITEISRLFDIAAGVRPGFFSKAHYATTKVIPGQGTKYLRVPDHVDGTLEVRTMDDILLDSDSYQYRDGHLIFKPCDNHVTCGCYNGCVTSKITYDLGWPDKCYKVRAKWGTQCADLAVQKAIRDYLVETYRMQDPVVQTSQGFPYERRFQVPYSWELYIRNFKDKRKIFSNYAIA